MKHLWLKYYSVYINHDPVMTLTQFMARSTWVDHVFKWGKLLKYHLKGKASRKLANGQNIDYSENKEENGPRASSAPTLGLNTIIFKHVYWYMQQTSGERLQDHLSSCCDITHKHSCPPRKENILKCKHLFISCVRIKIILLYGELSLINS